MKKIITIFISIITVLLISITSIYLAITKSLSEESINNNIKNNMFSSDTSENGDNSNLFKNIIEENIDKENPLSKIAESPTATDILSDVVESVYNYNLSGDDNYKYTEEEIVTIVENNIDEISKELDYELSDQEKEEILEYVKDNAKSLIDVIYDINIGEYRP